MDSITIEVYVPVIGKNYDIQINPNLMMWEINHMISGAIASEDKGRFIPTEHTVLCNWEDGGVVNLNITAEELKLQNGSKLMLI